MDYRTIKTEEETRQIKKKKAQRDGTNEGVKMK
jgi:hypothetical protein